MCIRRMGEMVLVLGMAACAMGSAATVPADLHAGMAEVEITPPVGYRLSGYFVERVSTGTHDPLKAKAIYISQGDTRVLLVACDLIGVPAEVSAKARAAIAERVGVPVSNSAITGTHTHTGPLYFGAMRDYLHAQAVEKHGRDPSSTVDFPALLVERVVDAAARARQQSRPVRLLSAFRTQEPTISFNRRFHMKDGRVCMNPAGSASPDQIDRPAGPIDPEVAWVVVQSSDGRESLGSLTVFATHPDSTGGLQFSADYPCYIETALRARYGPKFVSFFGLGTCGDINHLGRHTRAEAPDAQGLGQALARTLEAARTDLRPLAAPMLVARSVTVQGPLQKYAPEQVAQAARDIRKIGTGQLEFLREVEAYKITDLQSYPQDVLPLEVQVVRLDAETAIVLLPGEIFAETGLSIKRASPFKHTLVIELANHNPAYIPTRKAFTEGSYETVNSRVQPGTAELLADAAVRLLREVRP